MAWSVNGPDAPTPAPRQGWSVAGPDPQTTTKPGWSNVPQALAADIGVGEDFASIIAHLLAQDSGVGEDSASALITAASIVVADSGVGIDSAALKLHLLSSTDSGVGVDSATAVYSYVAPATTSYTTAGAFTYTIPQWCTHIDILALGGGGGGQGGGWVLANQGGLGGLWAWTTIQRGVDIPWSTSSLSGTVGTAGNGSSTSASPSAGGAGGTTSVTIPGNATLTGSGGSGGNGNATGISNQRGGPARGGNTGSENKDVLLNGVTYTGGAEQTSSANGNAPGGGGPGGNAFANGRNGAVGRAIFLAYQA